MQLHEAIALTVGVIILIIIAAYLIINQRSKVIEWLKGAVTEAEKELGEKTGQLKLRTVYDWFIQQFPIIASIVPFPVFSGWVDIALDTMEEWLDKNKQVKSYVKGESDEGNTETKS